MLHWSGFFYNISILITTKGVLSSKICPHKSVATNLSSKFDEFLSGRSQFDTDHRVDFYAHTCCQSAIFGPLFAFYCPLFFTKKTNLQCRNSPQMRFLRCSFRVDVATALRKVRLIARWQNGRSIAAFECGNVGASWGV